MAVELVVLLILKKETNLLSTDITDNNILLDLNISFDHIKLFNQQYFIQVWTPTASFMYRFIHLELSYPISPLPGTILSAWRPALCLLYPSLI